MYMKAICQLPKMDIVGLCKQVMYAIFGVGLAKQFRLLMVAKNLRHGLPECWHCCWMAMNVAW
jgi:hypothetical protein